MATRTNPLVSAAVLASTAAIAVATPAIMPSMQFPTPHALQVAKVQLATWADVMSITGAAISDTLFNGWGEAISPNQDLNIDWAAEYVGANVPRCDFSCTVPGPSGIAYMYLDALINGNGAGIDNIGGILENPAKPYQPDPNKPNYNPYKVQPWGVSAVNYFFEGGPGPGVQYLVSAPFGNPSSPLYNPAIAAAISQAFQGAYNVTIFYTQALNTLSLLALNVPAVGPYIYGGIQAYLGYTGYPQGLSGILKYVIDVAANGGQNPIPVPVQGGTGTAAATLAAASTAPAVASLEVSPVSKVAKDSTPAVTEVKDSTPADSKPEVQDIAPAVTEVKDSTPTDSKPAVSEVEDVTPVADDSKTAEAPKVEDVKDSTPAADNAPEAPEVSVPDTKDIQKDIEKDIAKAEKEAAKAEAAPADNTGETKSGGSDSKAGGAEATSGASTATSADASGASDAGASDAGSDKDAGDSAK